jgi:GTPase
MKPIIAIIGKPNVGKSTFFNALTRTQDALVDDFPGVTRDRHYGNASWDEKDFIVIDTGGFTVKEDAFSDPVRQQIFQAIEDADILVMMMDGKTGITPYDRDMVELLRPIKKPVFYVVNKIDTHGHESRLVEFYDLGIEKLYPLSASHRFGLPDFIDDLLCTIPESQGSEEKEVIRLAVVGRPNVGKSSLINRILGQDRLVVSDIPGTTRDAIDSVFEKNGKPYVLIDTAGIRRKGKVSQKIEKFSVIKALRSLERCDIALIVVDAAEGVTDQDISIAGYAFERGCGCLFILNKWDLIEKDTKTIKKYTETLRMASKFLSFAPVVTISALTGQRVDKIFNQVDTVYRQYATRLGTGKINKIIENAVSAKEPSLHRGRRIKFYYTTQISVKPPTFVSFVNYPEAVHFSYQRFLVNRIRQETGLDKTPVRLFLRPRTGRKTKD